MPFVISRTIMKQSVLGLISISCMMVGFTASAEADSNWTGLYLGGNIGAAWSTSKWTYPNVNPYDANGPGEPILGTINQFSSNGRFSDGFQVGYNYQICQFVMGPELAFFWSNLAKAHSNVVQIFPPNEQTVETRIKSYYTITGRIGVTFCSDWLIYGRAGYASAVMHTKGNVNPSFDVGRFDWETSNRHHGGVVGIGSEYKVTEHLCVGAEYNCLHLNNLTQVGNIPIVDAMNQVEHIVKADIQNVMLRASLLLS